MAVSLAQLERRPQAPPQGSRLPLRLIQGASSPPSNGICLSSSGQGAVAAGGGAGEGGEGGVVLQEKGPVAVRRQWQSGPAL
eukprot:SAG31_NODE_74_length_27628_cov_18.235642_15_plen_82_part_00